LELAAAVRTAGKEILRAAGEGSAALDAGMPEPVYELDPSFYDRGQELRFIVRLPETYVAVDRFTLAVSRVSEFTAGGRPRGAPPPGNAAELSRRLAAFAYADDRFEDAFRVELGGNAMTDEQRIAGL
jgi:hypothetical protein